MLRVNGWILRKVSTTKSKGTRGEEVGGKRERGEGGEEEVCAGSHLVVFSCIRAIDRDQLRFQDLRMDGWVGGEVV